MYARLAALEGFTDDDADPKDLTSHRLSLGLGGAFDRVVSPADRKAAVVIDSVTGLAAALHAVSPRIPDDRPAWPVHVVARAPGYLGSYRRCARCRRWFAGPYAPHAWRHTRGESPPR